MSKRNPKERKVEASKPKEPRNPERGARIKALRVAMGQTQDQVAEALGLSSRSAISKWEKGWPISELQILALCQFATDRGVTADPAYIRYGTQSALNDQALEEIITMVEELAAEEGRKHPPRTKAKIIMNGYRTRMSLQSGLPPSRCGSA